MQNFKRITGYAIMYITITLAVFIIDTYPVMNIFQTILFMLCFVSNIISISKMIVQEKIEDLEYEIIKNNKNRGKRAEKCIKDMAQIMQNMNEEDIKTILNNIEEGEK